MTLQCFLQCSLIIYLSIKSLTWWFHFYWFLLIYKNYFMRGRGKGNRHQIRNFNHQGKHKIGCYPKYITRSNAYQVQVWWNIILNPVKYQLDVRNVTEILLNISCHTHLKHSKPYMFILQKLKKPTDGSVTHLFFASAIILVFVVYFYIGSPS